MSAEIKLIDRNGLQTDGTALPNDTLDVSYGADLGTPNIIVWYCNGAAKAVYSLEGGNIDADSFMSRKVRDPLTGVLDSGDWWVTIENTAGQVSVTNVITVASNDIAIMSDFSLEDDYATPAVTIGDKPTNQVINVTFNKVYLGTLYVNAVDNETYTEAKMLGGNPTPANSRINLSTYTPTGGTWGNLTLVTKMSKLTDANALAGAAGTGIYYAEADGTVHAKIKVPAAVTRGTEYELIFDQADVTGDELGAKAKKEDLNVSNSFEAPYVVAPDEIVVTSYSKDNTTPKVTMYGEDGAVLDWWTAGASGLATITGFDSMKFYSIDSNTASDSDTPATTSDVKIDDGVVTLTINAAANDYGYAKFTTTKGIFAAKSATLTSEVYEGAMDPMTNMTLAQDSADPKAAKVSFKNLKGVASGTVYIFQDNASDASANVKALSETDKKKAVGSAVVEGGTTSVVIDDVFEAVETAPAKAANNKFVATFVPDNTELFKTVYNGSDNDSTIANPDYFTLKQKLTKYALVGDVAATTAIASKYKFSATSAYDSKGDSTGTVAYLEALDQFGDVIALSATNAADIGQASAEFEAVKSSFNGDPTYDPTVKAISVDTATAAAGATVGDKAIAVTLTDDGAMAAQKTLTNGNKISATLRTGQTLTLECKTTQPTTAVGTIEFALSLS